MNHPNTPGAAPEPVEPDGLPVDLKLSVTEIEALEAAILSARAEELAVAMNELGDADPMDPDARHFVDSVKSLWLSETRRAETGEEAYARDAPVTRFSGRTAILKTDEPSRTDTPIGSDRGFPIWPMAAAAAVLALIGWYGTRDAAELSPVYLGEGDGQRRVGESKPSTAPEVLPKTVDFSGDVPEYVTFRIEIHDVTRSLRVDDGIALEDTTYEPRWTCPEPDRKKLPAVFRLEVHREIEAPGTAPLWSRVYARQ